MEAAQWMRMYADALVMLLVVTALQVYFTFWKRVDARSDRPPRPWVGWLRRLWLLLSVFGAAFLLASLFIKSFIIEPSEWVAASRGMTCLSVLFIQIYMAELYADGPLRNEKQRICWEVGLSIVAVLLLAGCVAYGVVHGGADGPDGVLWGAFGVGSLIMSIASTYTRRKALSGKGALTIAAAVNWSCVALSVGLTVLSAMKKLTDRSFAAQCAVPVAAIIALTWRSELWKHLKTLAASGWHLVTKHANTRLDTNGNADARNRSTRPTASQASLNRPSSDGGMELYEMADDVEERAREVI